MNTTTTNRISEGTASAQRIHKSVTADPFLLDTTPRKHPPLRYIKRADAGPACGFGTCSLSPECTSTCRYREADQALRGHYAGRHTQRQAMPPTNNRTGFDQRTRDRAIQLRQRIEAQEIADAKLRRRVVLGILALYGAAIGFSLWWALI